MYGLRQYLINISKKIPRYSTNVYFLAFTVNKNLFIVPGF